MSHSAINRGSVIDGTVENSVLSPRVTIEKGARVSYSVLLPGVTVESGAVIEYAIIGENTVVESNAQIGARPESITNRDEWGIAVVGHNVNISENAKVLPKQIVSENI